MSQARWTCDVTVSEVSQCHTAMCVSQPKIRCIVDRYRTFASWRWAMYQFSMSVAQFYMHREGLETDIFSSRSVEIFIVRSMLSHASILNG